MELGGASESSWARSRGEGAPADEGGDWGDAGELPSDAREQRAKGNVEARVVLEEPRVQWGDQRAPGSGAALDGDDGGDRRAGTVTSQHRVVTVRITCQTRYGGARVGGNAVAWGAAAEPRSSAPRAGSGRGGVTLFSLPYSEHSSFSELRECVAALNPVEVIPTVNCASSDDAKRLVALLRGDAAAPPA